MSLLMENAATKIGCGDPGDPIDFSALLNGEGYLDHTFDTGVQGQYVLCGWFKPSKPDVTQTIISQRHEGVAAAHTWFGLEGGDTFRLFKRAFDGTTVNVDLSWVGARHDMAAPFHWHLAVDPSQPAADRFTLTVGLDVLEKQAGAIYSSDAQAELHFFIDNSPLRIGARHTSGASDYAHGYLSEFHGVWMALPSVDEFVYRNSHGALVNKHYSGDHGEFGFHLDFADPLDLGKDVSGNNNHFTVLGGVEQTTDSPTHNAVTLNPSENTGSNSGVYSEGNLATTANAGTSSFFHTLSGLIPRSGVWKWEQKIEADGASFYPGYGIYSDGHSVVRYRTSPSNTHTYIDGIPTAYATTNAAAGGVFGFEFDADALTLKIYRDGTLETTHNVPQGNWRIAQNDRASSSSSLIIDPNKFAFPEVFSSAAKGLSSDNYPCPLILDPSKYYQREQLLGGADLPLNWNPLSDDTLTISGRTDSAQEYRVNMIIGGVQVNPFNTAGTGGEIVGEDGLTFNSGGATIGTNVNYQGTRRDRAFRCTPKSGMALVTFTHVNGTPTVVNHTAGGVAEEITFFPISGGDRREYHKYNGGDAFTRMNGPLVTSAPGFISGNVANQFVVNGSMPSGTFHAWVKRSVDQFSSVFDYEGNNASVGPHLPADFEPNLLTARNLNSGVGKYVIKDNLRSNPDTSSLALSGTTANNVTNWDMDFYSNGAKWRNTYAETNGFDHYIGFAIAKTPIKFSNAV